MNAQVVVSFLRWVAIGILVGAGSAVADLLSGESVERAILKGVGLAMPIWLGALGWGGFDSHRASVVHKQLHASQMPTALKPYDVGYTLLEEYKCLHADYSHASIENERLRNVT
jgi:hypothetical protein